MLYKSDIYINIINLFIINFYILCIVWWYSGSFIWKCWKYIRSKNPHFRKLQKWTRFERICFQNLQQFKKIQLNLDFWEIGYVKRNVSIGVLLLAKLEIKV